MNIFLVKVGRRHCDRDPTLSLAQGICRSVEDRYSPHSKPSREKLRAICRTWCLPVSHMMVNLRIVYEFGLIRTQTGGIVVC